VSASQSKTRKALRWLTRNVNKKREQRHLAFLLPVLMVLCGGILLVSDPLPVRALRNTAFDQYQRWHPRTYQPAPVRIVDIDDESLAALGQWPWPRTRIADLVDKLREAGAAAITFDVVFAEADRTSPRAMTRQWGLHGSLQQALTHLPDHDAVLAKTMAYSPVVLGFSLKHGKLGDDTSAPLTTRRPFRYINAGPPPDRWLHNFETTVPPLPILQSAAQGLGAVTFVSDGDGIVRRVPMVLALNGKPVPTLVSESLRVGAGTTNYFLKSDDADVGLSNIRIGEFNIPTTAEGELWVHYSPPVPERYISAWRVMVGEVPNEQLNGTIVLIGSSAQGLMDLRFNPLGRFMPGVEAHAQALEQILTDHYLVRPGWAKGVEALATVIGGLIAGFVAVRASALLAAGTTAAMLAGILGGGWYAFDTHLLLINSLTPALVVLLSFILGSLVHHYMSEYEQRWIKAAFARYVSPNRVAHLVDHPEAMELGGRRQECSFIFTDLAGFTTLLESMDPAAAVSLLNAYLDRMIEIAFRHEGTLDRIVGDAVAIMFSAPVVQPDHRARALSCALEMDAFATQYANELNAQGTPFGKTRIGIHSGEVIIGNFGGSNIFDYRALGDPVNTASRLESVNKHLGTHICVSQDTLSGCPEAHARRVGRLVLKGKTKPLQVLEPFAGDYPAHYAPLADYEAAYEHMAQGQSAAARAAFQTLAAQYPQDPLVALQTQRLSQGDDGDLIHMSEK